MYSALYYGTIRSGRYPELGGLVVRYWEVANVQYKKFWCHSVCLLLGSGSLLGGFVIGGSTVYVCVQTWQIFLFYYRAGGVRKST